MRKLLASGFLSLMSLAAQDLAITNARLIIGNGTVINSGTLIVRGGKIVSAAAGSANTQGLKTIDAKGMTRHAGVHRCPPAHQYRAQ